MNTKPEDVEFLDYVALKLLPYYLPSHGPSGAPKLAYQAAKEFQKEMWEQEDRKNEGN